MQSHPEFSCETVGYSDMALREAAEAALRQVGGTIGLQGRYGA